MAFIDARLPEVVERRAQMGPAFSTRVVALRSGAEHRNINRARARIEATISKLGLSEADYYTLLAWFRLARGRAHSFRVKDWTDYSTSQTTGALQGVRAAVVSGTVGVGWGEPVYQIVKKYTAGSFYTTRELRALVTGSLTIKRDLATVTAGAGAGQVAIDLLTGRITFVADASESVSAVTVGATTQVTLANPLSGVATGGRLYLTGLTGADAALLNGLSHAVTNVAGAVYTLSTNTAGKTITAAGSGRKYPQPTEALTVAAEFDVPMRFDVDALPATLEAFNLISAEGVPLIEVLDEESDAYA